MELVTDPGDAGDQAVDSVLTLSEKPPGAVVLVVEADDGLATQLLQGLNGAGYSPRRAASVGQALAAVQSTPPDLIVMSYILPGAAGLALCATLKVLSQAPVIVLSARPGDVDRALAFEAGAADWFTKPVDIDKLLVRIESIVPADARKRVGRA
jgi:DNA-binding response OmpR family regulator